MLVFTAIAPMAAQELLTAPRFFDTVAERYSSIEDYVARIVMRNGEDLMEGTLYHRRPNLIRIDFTRPADQVLVSDGRTLLVHVPRYNVTLQQELRQRQDNVGGLATEQGLRLMRANYSIAYLEGPAPVPLEDGSNLMVTRLRLDWRNTNEGFRQLVLSVDDNGLIRRIEGITVGYDEIRFDFRDIRLNQSIPVTRFDYTPPTSANRLNNFLFEQEG
ncbi:MAG: outer membrane lipoprotein carrier protein LolA [Spirochaetaceae bacterium]|nr:MAG: outer membrane lipoprotein carrier protein LolA [Spirochaetaceae bacterium]